MSKELTRKKIIVTCCGSCPYFSLPSMRQSNALPFCKRIRRQLGDAKIISQECTLEDDSSD